MDGSETLNLAIEAILVGATLTDGTHSFIASQDTTTADITGWNLGQLAIVSPKDYNGQFTLKIVATATEQANQAKAISVASLLVTVLPVNDAPLAHGASYILTTSGSVIIDFAQLISDADGDILTLSFANPKQGNLTKNADGTYTYTPKRGFTGTETFAYTVTDSKLTATASITLTVPPRKDDDDDHCHHDNGNHNGFDHSGHYGYQGCDDGRGASLTVQSTYTSREGQNVEQRGYVVVNHQNNRSASKIDWAGYVSESILTRELKDENWVADLFGAKRNEKSLAEKTGLTIKMPR